MRILALCGAALTLSACAALEKDVAVEPPVNTIPVRPDGAVRIDTNDQQTARLWASAEQARQAGQTSAALEILYEALDNSPQNALLWSRAAELQLDSLEATLAESYATKSNAYAGDNRPLLYRNWLIIEHARNMRGDLLGVRSARIKVQEYQYQ